MKSRVRQIGLESPISFADLLEKSEKVVDAPKIPDFRSDDTETPSNEVVISDEIEDDEEDEIDNDTNNELSITTTKNLLQVSEIDGSLLDRTMDAFCQNLKNSVNEQFLSSRERLFRQTENEINSITKIYQDTLNNKEKELNELKNDYDSLNEKYNSLNVEFCKLETSNSETKKKLKCVRDLSQTVMKWKNECDKKRFITNYVNNKIIPNKERIRLQNIYYFWKQRALQNHYKRYDEIWEKRLETVSKKIIEKYEININKLRDELMIKNEELKQLTTERKQQQENMKRAFMRGVSALNLEAMSLFDRNKYNENKENTDKPRTQIPSQQI